MQSFVVLLVMAHAGQGLIRLPLKRQIIHQPSELDVGHGTPVQVPITNMRNVAYIATIQIGGGHQEFQVIFDTGSSDLFVPSVDCLNCGTHQTYFCRNLSRHTTNLFFGTGKGGGHFCTDSVRIGGLTVQNQEFIVLDHEDSFFQSSPFDGILGMSYKYHSSSYRIMDSSGYIEKHQITPVFQNLVQQLGIAKVFSLYLTLYGSDQSTAFLGGSDPNYYNGELKYVNVTPIAVPVYGYFGYSNTRHIYGSWQVQMTSFKVGGQELISGPVTVVVDSGTSALTLPMSVYMSRLQGMGRMIPCMATNQLPTITLVLENRYRFTFDGQDYTFPMHRGLCEIVVSPSRNSWILGDVFFRKYYVEFDMERNRIGFARSKSPS